MYLITRAPTCSRIRKCVFNFFPFVFRTPSARRRPSYSYSDPEDQMRTFGRRFRLIARKKKTRGRAGGRRRRCGSANAPTPAPTTSAFLMSTTNIGNGMPAAVVLFPRTSKLFINLCSSADNNTIFHRRVFDTRNERGPYKRPGYVVIFDNNSTSFYRQYSVIVVRYTRRITPTQYLGGFPSGSRFQFGIKPYVRKLESSVLSTGRKTMSFRFFPIFFSYFIITVHEIFVR